MDMAEVLRANAEQMRQFIGALFVYADEDSFVSLRAFDQKDRGKPPVEIKAIRLGDHKRLLDEASRVATIAANSIHPAVFAPPVATFSNANQARHIDLANGVALSVEIDAGDTARARATLEHILGPVTICMASGSEWMDEATGEYHPKLHLHWRLSEPTRTAQDHDRLKEARWCAAVLVGGDTTAAPPCHPLRWPGSWNTKRSPKMARILTGNQAAEIHLDDALERLQAAVEAAGLDSAPASERVSSTPQASVPMVVDALQTVANDDMHWEEWNRIGMAMWAATGGSEDGLKGWADWSAKSTKHEEAACADRWKHYGTSPPSRIGAGTILRLAAISGWQRPQPEQSEPPPSYSEEEWASLEAHVTASANEAPPTPKATGKTHIWEHSDEWDEQAIPPRDWIAKGYFIRKSVTVIAGSGSAGKSSISVCYAIALALGRTWSRFKPVGPCRVMIYNTEDDDDEQRRRLSATLRQFKVSSAAIKDKVFRAGPHALGTLVNRDPSSGKLSLTDVMADLERRIDDIRPDVVILDPMIELHNCDENDNNAQRAIVAFMRTLAVRYSMAVGLIHHARKGSGGSAGDPDMIRGAGSIIGACRVALTVVVMTEEEAAKLNVPPAERHDYFRVDGAKSNYAKLETAEWFRRAVYTLSNGDEVAAPTPWEAKAKASNISSEDLNKALDRIAQGYEPGVRYAASKRGASNHRWVGFVLTELCEMDEAMAGKFVFDWLRTRLLFEENYRDPTDRKTKPGVYVDSTKRPS